jgi:hypothetical protein
MHYKYRSARRIIFIVAIASISGYSGIFFGIYFLKLLSAVSQILALVLSISVFIQFYGDINWKKFIPIICFLSIYPLTRILISSLNIFEFKTLTDAIILNGGYYQLVFAGFALALLTKEENGYDLLVSYSLFAIPTGILLTFIIFLMSSRVNINSTVGLSDLVITNCFIPLALLAYYPVRIKNLLIGWLSIIMILIVSININSRSFTIVALLLSIGAVFSIFKMGKRNLAFLTLIIVLLIFTVGGSLYLNQKSKNQEVTIIDKFQLNSLTDRAVNFTKEGNIEDLFYWEGNSRSTILVDAFKNFDSFSWVFGVGIFKTYSSFVERSTIEMGWAQETFRWGLIYVFITFIIILYSRRYLKSNEFYYLNQIYRILSLLVLIRFLDGFLYGVPETSIYNLLFFWGVMSQCVYIDHEIGYYD